MGKKKYGVQWEDEKAVAFEVDGVRYASLKEIPDPQDRRKLQKMLSAASSPDFDAEDWEATRKEADKAQQIILWVFSGVAALMLLITAIAAWLNLTQVANERSTARRHQALASRPATASPLASARRARRTASAMSTPARACAAPRLIWARLPGA